MNATLRSVRLRHFPQSIKELCIHVNQVMVGTNDFFQVIFSLRKSFKTTVNIVSRLFCWRYSREEAFTKAENFMLDSANPEKSQVTEMSKKFQIVTKGSATFVQTRPFVDPQGLVIVHKYRLLDRESPVVRRVIQDSHTHGLGYLNHLNSVLRKGFISTNLKKLIKKHQSSCVTCRRLRLLPSTS